MVLDNLALVFGTMNNINIVERKTSYSDYRKYRRAITLAPYYSVVPLVLFDFNLVLLISLLNICRVVFLV
jgi:hypothetical protein